LTSEVRGEVETEDDVLVVKRIHVIYVLRAPKEARETIERVHRIHAMRCPLYRTLHGAIAITTEVRLQDEN
jgi:uncharacterized OsmC-like protein